MDQLEATDFLLPVSERKFLDKELFCLSGVSRERHPLLLRRFCEWGDYSNAVSAIQSEARNLMAKYRVSFGNCSPAVRVKDLCNELGIPLRAAKFIAKGKIAQPISASQHNSCFGELRMANGSPAIYLWPSHSRAHARVTVAHEIAHALTLRRRGKYEHMLLRRASSPEEEAIAEYGARLLLMDSVCINGLNQRNLATKCLALASKAQVTTHASAMRLADPDLSDSGIRAVALWRMRLSPNGDGLLAPLWYQSMDGAFPFPLQSTSVQARSVIAAAAEAGMGKWSGMAIEDVRMGSFRGRYNVHVSGWGNAKTNRRFILSIFVSK